MWKYYLRLFFSVPIPAKVCRSQNSASDYFFLAKNHALQVSSNRGRKTNKKRKRDLSFPWLFSQALPLFSHNTDTHTRAYTFQNNHRICVLKNHITTFVQQSLSQFEYTTMAPRFWRILFCLNNVIGTAQFPEYKMLLWRLGTISFHIVHNTV